MLIANSGMIAYQWSPLTSNNDSVYVQAGVYSLSTVDINGCMANTTATVTLDTSFSIPSANDTTVCAGSSATLFATGLGQMEWYASLFSTSPIYIGSPFTTPPITIQTTYYIATSSSNGCHSLRDSVKIFIIATSLPPDITVTSFLCSDSSIYLTTSNQQNASYSWVGPNGFSSTLQNPIITTASPVNSGIYTLVVSGNGCMSPPVTDSVFVAPPTIAQISGATSVCPGDSVLLIANSGMIAYQWLPLTSNNDSVYVPAGIYSLWTTDVNGCTATTTVTVATDTSFTVPSANDTTVCEGSSATLYATGIGQMEWYASLSSTIPIYVGNSYTTPPITIQNTYYIATSSTNGCHSLRDSVKVSVTTTSLTPNIASNSPVCNNNNIVFSTSNQQNASYSWVGPNGFSSTLQNPIITNASSVNSGIYTLVVSGNGCVSPPVMDTVLIITVASPAVTGNDTVCAGDSISLFINSPVTNTIYYWSGPSGFSSSGISIAISPSNVMNAGIYNAYGSTNGCTSALFPFSVFVKPSGPSVTVSSNSPVCSGDTLLLSASGGNIYQWTGPSGFSTTVQNPEIVPATVANTGIFSVAAIFNGCSGNPSNVNIVVNALPVLSLGADTIICSKNPVLLHPTGYYYSYQWSNDSTNSSIWVLASGEYSLTVTDTNGCKSSSTISIGLIDCNAQSTNIFTPNGDGLNEQFTFSGRSFKKVQCEIFDRWGRKIYSWDNPDGGWDGTDSQTKRAKPSGTYYYVVQIITFDDKTIELKGFIDLIR